MTVLWSADLEPGNYTQFGSTTVAGTGATLTANAASAYVGSFGSDAFVNGATNDSAYASSPAQTTTTKILSAQCRFKVHQNNVGGAGEAYLLILHDSGDTIGSQFENFHGTWRILITNSNGTATATNLTQQTFTVDQFYLIELIADWNVTNSVVWKLYIDGVLDTTYTDTTVASPKVWAKVLGGIYLANATTGVVETYTDDYKLGDALIGLPSGFAALPVGRGASGG